MEDPNKIENNILGLLQKSSNLKSFTKLINSGNKEFARVNEFSSIHPISDKQIYYCFKNAANCYDSFTIKKKSGADREINAPQPGLKQIQKSIKACMDIFLPQSHNSHGFLSGKSIKTNSNPHVGKNHVLNMDIENFFPSISYGRLYVVLQMPPLKCSPYVAKRIATLCTLNDCLPQGSPTSPVFTNLICQRLDRKLSYIAAKYNCAQTRYVDDITFSSDSKAQLVKAHDKTVKLIEDEGFSEKTEKTRYQSKSIRQEVTGLTVNDFTNSSRKFRRETRAMLHDWTVNGLQNASRAHKSDITTDTFKEIVNGRVAFIRSISDTPESRELLKLLKELKNG